MTNYLIFDSSWEFLDTKIKDNASLFGQLIICNSSIQNQYHSLRYSVYNPSSKDLIRLIAMFNDKEDAVLFVIALTNKECCN